MNQTLKINYNKEMNQDFRIKLGKRNESDA